MDDSDYVRLHITPLTPSLIQTYLPASMQENARNVSYHKIQTFPENSYGFVELPQKDAERIKKKLHGSIIKNVKVRVEIARPIKFRVSKLSSPELGKLVVEHSPLSQTASIERHQCKKKRKLNELLGIEIGRRKVKRGWTVPAHELKKIDIKNKTKLHTKFLMKSKFTPRPECLFKALLPANLITLNPQTSKAIKNKRNRNSREFLVHEFSNTTKYATFLKDNSKSAVKESSNKIVAKYVEGKGWFDQQNNLVEKLELEITKNPKRSVRNFDRKKIKKIEANKMSQTNNEPDFEPPSSLSSSKNNTENELNVPSLDQILEEL
ncbi:putative suppressor protein srp40 protein [Erysiphe neolycopersici]|uniref:Putative suppressor protein srp40 protein n=1 Tax=Erysiphe neolycopersici TaxID=212602 RepID=A0A420HP21_9PEZI|nr:putative suppressor protein srp40 protein [Erysiphe neolycopersici]